MAQLDSVHSSPFWLGASRCNAIVHRSLEEKSVGHCVYDKFG